MFVCLAALGCGRALIPGQRVDEPIFTFDGDVEGEAPGADLRLGLLWVDPFGLRDDLASPPSVSAGALSADRRTFELQLFTPPPPEVVRAVPDPADPSRPAFSFALAELVVFDDADGDGVFHVGGRAEGSKIEAPDTYRGASPLQALFYVATVRSDASPALKELDRIVRAGPGYRVGTVGCDGAQGYFNTSVQEDIVRLRLVEAQETLPQLRPCLRSYPAPLP